MISARSSAETTDKRAEQSLVEVHNAEVTFETRKGLFRTGYVHALNDVSILIGSRETLALVGESGSGKTTLGRLTLRLVDPSAGSVWFDGTDITNLKQSELHWFRERAQIIFQDPFSSLNPYMRVRDLVEEPLIIDGMKDADARWALVEEALTAVDLIPASRFASKFPNQMSGGQRQRVGIARALVRHPDYVVADEPVSMIDASSRIEILNLLSTLQAEQEVAFLFITHDIATARHFSDRIGVMYLGTIVEEGIPGSVIDHPLHPYTKALIEAIPEPDPANRFLRRAVVPGEPPQAGEMPEGCPFFDRCPERIPGTCDATRPVLAEQESGHSVACFLYPGQESPSTSS